MILNFVVSDHTTSIQMKGKLYWNWFYPFCSALYLPCLDSHIPNALLTT